ncbi:MAG: UDP-glucose 4-epimerase GalE [Candidatus Marinimicrobia bacterium]|nr:UDP-glucose 4-epimerase GalE [Candidatus Neomarinimicrobiota bacterium]|tara:strand:- start:8715 stop:9698 length:984 start_codon:yes stop_codon:yes gene_type:complete
MNILITGGAGYIGSHVALALLDEGHSVSIIDDLSTGHLKLIPKNADFFECNINDEVSVSKIIKSSNFDAIMHFAGFIKVEESVNNPDKYIKNNTKNAIKLFEICHSNNLKNIIFSSTAAIYGNPKNNESIKETELLQPQNPYGESKLETEKFLLNNKDKFNSTILRYFNVAGADNKLRSGLVSKDSTHLIKILSEVAVGKRDKILIFGDDYNTKDGTAVRDYIHVSDLANIHSEALKHLLQNKETNVFNCGYGNGFSVLEVVNETNKITNGKIKFEYTKRRPGDSEKLVSNVEKLNQNISWHPKYNNLSLIIESAIKWESKLNEKDL